MTTKIIDTKKVFSILSTLIIATMMVFSLTASAQGSEGSGNADSGSENSSGEGQKNAGAIKGCENVSGKIQQVANKFQTSKQTHTQAYEQIRAKVQTYIEYAEEKDANASALKTKLQEMEQLVNQFSNQTQTQDSYLSQSQAQACGAKASEFRGSLFKAQQQMREVAQTALKIKECLQNEIIPEIQNIQEEINK